MNRTPIEIDIPMNPRKATINVDGRNLDAITGIHIDASYSDFPRVTLDLVSPVHFQGHAHIELAGSITDDLKHLGWSEPSERARLAKAIRELLDAISDMAVRNSDVDTAATVLRGELVDAGWDEAPECGSCKGTRWVDDQNWQPEDYERAQGRVPGSGRIPCGSCNHGGWNVPDGKPSATLKA